MPSRVALAPLVVLGLVLVAGCLGAPTTGPSDPAPGNGSGTVEYSVSNAANQSVRVVVAVVPPEVDSYRIEYANGTNRTVVNLGNLSSLTAAVPDDAVAVVPLGERVVVRSYTLTPGSGVGGTIESAPDDGVVLLSVSYPERGSLRDLSAARCADAALTRVELEVADDAIAVAVACTDERRT